MAVSRMCSEMTIDGPQWNGSHPSETCALGFIPFVLSPRQPDLDHTTSLVGAIGEFQRSAVAFGNLPGENQPDATSLRLGGVERNENVARIHQTRPAVFDCEDD